MLKSSKGLAAETPAALTGASDEAAEVGVGANCFATFATFAAFAAFAATVAAEPYSCDEGTIVFRLSFGIKNFC